MKKFLAIVLALILIFAMSTNVFATSLPTNQASTSCYDKFDTIGITGGTGFNGVAFGPLGDDLAKLFPGKNIVSIDLPGHSDFSLLPEKSYTYNNYVKDLTKQIKKFKGGILLVGHSLGASVLLGVASKNLSNVVGVVSIDGSDRFTSMQDETSRNAIWAEVESVVGSIYGPAAIEVARKDFIIDIALDIRNKLSTIKKPVLLLYGADDPIATPDDQTRMAKSLGCKATLDAIPGVAHALPLLLPSVTAEHIYSWACKVHIYNPRSCSRSQAA